MVVPYHFLIHHCDVRDLYTWIMHLVEEVSRIPGSSILCLLDLYLSSACALGLHSSSSMCILCAPQSSVSGLCARKFRGLHYRILLVPGAATMDLWTVFCGISDSAGIPVQGTSFALLVTCLWRLHVLFSSVVLSWFSKSVLVDCDSCHRLYKCSILVLSHFCTFLPFTSAFVCCLLYGSLLWLVFFHVCLVLGTLTDMSQGLYY